MGLRERLESAIVPWTASVDTEARCVRCGYRVYGLPEPRCPECGSDLNQTGVRVLDSQLGLQRRRWLINLPAAALSPIVLTSAYMLIWHESSLRSMDMDDHKLLGLALYWSYVAVATVPATFFILRLPIRWRARIPIAIIYSLLIYFLLDIYSLMFAGFVFHEWL